MFLVEIVPVVEVDYSVDEMIQWIDYSVDKRVEWKGIFDRLGTSAARNVWYIGTGRFPFWFSPFNESCFEDRGPTIPTGFDRST